MTKIVAVVNQKGGVGKTCTTLNLAETVARTGRTVLVVDLDAQANATQALAPADVELTTNDVLASGGVGVAADAVTTAGPHWHPGVSLIPSETALAERESHRPIGWESALRNALKGIAADLVLIDCPPSLGVLATNALVAADVALLITEPAAASLAGIGGVEETIGAVVTHYNPELRTAGIIVNRMESTRDARRRLTELTEARGDAVWHPPIPKRALIPEAFGAHAPVHLATGSAELVAVYALLAERLTEGL